MTPHLVVVKAAVAAATTVISSIDEVVLRRKQRKHRSRLYSTPIVRERRTVEEIHKCLGDVYFRRAYRMSFLTFQQLHQHLHDNILKSLNVLNTRKLKKNIKLALSINWTPKGNYSPKICSDFLVPNTASTPTRYKPPPVTNGRISTSSRLACALRYFAGGSVYDIMVKYGMSHSSVYESIWVVVDAVNSLRDLDINYPEEHSRQRLIAADFEAVSGVNFTNCAGAIDGMLVWMMMPTEEGARDAGIGRKSFLCGRKGKFGLSLQAVSDRRGRFLDVSITSGGATADCIAFEASDLYKRLQNNVLAPGLVLFGDNAYLNSAFMATPYSNVSSGSKDNYNFYHSQLRIRVECAFGMLVQRWGILRTPISSGISPKRVIAMVICLAKLHNFCIDSAAEEGVVPEDPLERFSNFSETIHGYTPLEPSNEHPDAQLIPRQLLDGGNHYLGCPRRDDANSLLLPRQRLHDHVVESHKVRPPTIRRTGL